MGNSAKDFDVDVVKEGGRVVSKEASNYFNPVPGKAGMGEKDVEEVVMVDGVEGLADVDESTVEERVRVPFLVLLTEEEEEGLLVAVSVRAKATLAGVWEYCRCVILFHEVEQLEVDRFVEKADENREKGDGAELRRVVGVEGFFW